MAIYVGSFTGSGGSGGAPSGTASGDLAATYPGPTVVAVQSATTRVALNGAAAPTVGQVLTAVDGTSASWQAPTGGAPSGAATGDLASTYPAPTVVAVQSATTRIALNGAAAPTAGQVLTASSGTVAAWVTPTPAPVTSVGGQTGAIATLNHAADLTNVGANTHAAIDTFIASRAAASGLASLDANSRVVEGAAKKRGVYVSVTNSQTLGTTQPLSILDATMAGLTAGGSTTGAGVDGVVAFSFSASATETSGGAGQAGLGANTPLTDAAYAGVRIPVELRKLNGSDVQLADILAVTTEPSTAVYAYLSYRSDLGANAHWRLWFYYRRAADGVEVAVTPTISLTNAALFAPIVYFSGDVPIAADFADSVLVAGERAAENAPLSITTGMLADLAVTTGKIAALGVTTAKIDDLSVTTGKVALLAITDAQVATANKDGAAATASMRTLRTTAPTTTVFNASGAAGSSLVAAPGDHTHPMAAVPGSASQVLYNATAATMAAASLFEVQSDRAVLVGETAAATAISNRVILQGLQRDSDLANYHLAYMPPVGQVRRLQDGFNSRQIAIWTPAVTTAMTYLGLIPTNTGTWSTITPTTGVATQFIRTRSTSSASAGSTASIRAQVNPAFYIGDAAGRGGWSMGFTGIMLSTVTTNGRGFVGLSATTTVLGNSDPSALGNFIAFAFDTAQTTWRVMHNDGSGTATTLVDLGSDFPTNSTSAMFNFYCQMSANGTTFSWRAERVDTAVTAQHGVSGSSNLPANTAFMIPHIQVNNAADAVAVSIDISKFYGDFGTVPLAA